MRRSRRSARARGAEFLSRARSHRLTGRPPSSHRGAGSPRQPSAGDLASAAGATVLRADQLADLPGSPVARSIGSAKPRSAPKPMTGEAEHLDGFVLGVLGDVAVELVGRPQGSRRASAPHAVVSDVGRRAMDPRVDQLGVRSVRRKVAVETARDRLVVRASGRRPPARARCAGTELRGALSEVLGSRRRCRARSRVCRAIARSRGPGQHQLAAPLASLILVVDAGEPEVAQRPSATRMRMRTAASSPSPRPASSRRRGGSDALARTLARAGCRSSRGAAALRSAVAACGRARARARRARRPAAGRAVGQAGRGCAAVRSLELERASRSRARVSWVATRRRRRRSRGLARAASCSSAPALRRCDLSLSAEAVERARRR